MDGKETEKQNNTQLFFNNGFLVLFFSYVQYRCNNFLLI